MFASWLMACAVWPSLLREDYSVTKRIGVLTHIATWLNQDSCVVWFQHSEEAHSEGYKVGHGSVSRG